MSAFIDAKATERIEFEDDQGRKNAVEIKAKMDYGTRAKVQRDMVQMSFDEAGGEVEDVKISASPLLRELALLKHNIVRWSGPLFTMPHPKGRRRIPCKPEWIARLDIDENRYWVDQVLDRIYELNLEPEAEPDPEEEQLLEDPDTDPKESQPSDPGSETDG